MRKIENNTIGRLTSQDAASRSFAQQVWLQYKRNKAAMVGLIFLCVLLFIVVATYIIDFATDGAFYTENVIAQNLRARLHPPSAQHWFGCDELGRDLLYRILWGARLSLLIGFVAVAISMLFGSGLGILAGYYGGKTDAIIMRIMDVFLAIPSMVLSIAVVTGLGTSTISLLLSIAVAQVPHFARVAKAAVISVKDSEFIEAARTLGANDFDIIIKNIIPNAMSPVIVQATLGTGNAILTVSSLSYLGLGIQAPAPEWGTILSTAKMYMRDAWHISVIPGLAIMLTVLTFNLMGDGIRDALDPKLKS